MSARDKSTNTEPDPNIAGRRHFLGIKVKDLLQIISQLLLPLILAIFTIVVTFDQRSENRIQRIEDRRAAEGQREQDLNTSHELRENDRWIAEEQRKHDKQIAADKRAADDLNAEIQRNMTRDQRIYEINIEQERYKKEYETYLDNLLLSYYNEMGELLQKQNGISLVSHPVSFALARSKTLNTIEQVGPRRAARLIMFLYGAGQLTIGDKSLDLTEADLNNIDLRSQRNLGKIYLSAAYLNNASFDGQDLSYANFKNAQLSNATFKNSICVGTRFDGAQLIKADFTGANISGASFVKSNLQQASFYQASGDSPLFQYTRMQEANFSDCHFTFESIATNGFIDSNLAASDFRHANLQQSRFFYCNLTYANFANANLRRADMTGCDMSHAFFLNSDLGFTVLFSTNLSYANLSTIQCTGTYLNISACKLNQALTLANAHLPDRSFGLPLAPFFTVKDHPQCQRDVLGEIFLFANDSQWKMEPFNSVFNQYRFLPDNYVKVKACAFTPIKTPRMVSLTRNIDLTRYRPLIQAKRAQAAIRCFVGYSTRVTITELIENQTKLEPDDWTAFRWFALLKPTTTSLRITVQFAEPMNETFSWFHDIQLDIYADIKAPDSHLLLL